MEGKCSTSIPSYLLFLSKLFCLRRNITKLPSSGKNSCFLVANDDLDSFVIWLERPDISLRISNCISLEKHQELMG